MAIEQAPVEINLREPRRPSRDFYALLWLGGWGAAAAIALSALVLTSQTPTANERLRSIFAINEPAAVAQMPPRVAQLESEARMLMEQVRTLSADRDRLNGRIALLESSIDDMTGTIKRQAAATAARLPQRRLRRRPTAQPQSRRHRRAYQPRTHRLRRLWSRLSPPSPKRIAPPLQPCHCRPVAQHSPPSRPSRRPAANSDSILAGHRRWMGCGSVGRP